MTTPDVLVMLNECEAVLTEEWEGGGALWAMTESENEDAARVEELRVRVSAGDVLQDEDVRLLREIHARNCAPPEQSTAS